MWFLKNVESGDIMYLKPNKSMIVSRKQGYDILLKDDASISKLHASITVRPKINFQNTETSSSVYVQDSNSKYGTYVIDDKDKSEKLTTGEYLLTESHKIKFGLQHHIFTLHYVPFILSASTLNSREKVELQNIIDTVDGVIIEKWAEYCTHLTVSNVTLTTQVVQALAFGTPIVSLDYWRAVLRSVESNQKLPDIENFIPSINEGTINRDSVSLEVNLKRKDLFRNIAFISFSQSQYALREIVRCAGGNLGLFKEGKFTVNQLCSRKVVVLQISNDSSEPSQSSVSSYNSIQKALQERKRRLIPESEIFLAILYCSIEKYCNPSFDFKQLIGTSGRNKNENLLSSAILVPDTQDMPPTQRLPRKIIPESLTSSEQVVEQDFKKLKTINLSLRKKQNAEKSEDSSQAALGNRRIFDRSALVSEESSREGTLMIDETRSSVESDNNDFEEIGSKLKKSTIQSTTRRFNLQSKLQTPSVPKKDNVETAKRPAPSPAKNDIPSTSKDTRWKNSRDFESMFENEEISSRKRTKNVFDQKLREKSPQEEFPRSKRAEIAKTKSTKRSRSDEEDMFAFVNESALKRKKTARQDDENNLFILLEDPNITNSDQEENMFETGLQKIKKEQIKRRRSSISSNDSSIEEELPRVKIERLDSNDEVDAPLIRCKKELDSSINETCKSTLMSLLRSDIDLTLDSTTGNMKTFIKMYTEIPKQRIRPKDMYVWKCEEESTKSVYPEKGSSSSSEEDENAFGIQRNKKPTMKIKRRT